MPLCVFNVYQVMRVEEVTPAVLPHVAWPIDVHAAGGAMRRQHAQSRHEVVFIAEALDPGNWPVHIHWRQDVAQGVGAGSKAVHFQFAQLLLG